MKEGDSFAKITVLIIETIIYYKEDFTMKNEKKAELIAFTICPVMDGFMGGLAVLTILNKLIKPDKSLVRYIIYVMGVISGTIGQMWLIDKFDDTAVYENVYDATYEFLEKHKKTK